VAEKRQRAKQRQAARREARQAERGDGAATPPGGDGAPGGGVGTPGGGSGMPGGGLPGGTGAPGGGAPDETRRDSDETRSDEAARARDPERQEFEDNVDLEVGAPPEDVGFSEFTTRHAEPDPPDFEIDDEELADDGADAAAAPRTRGPRGVRGGRDAAARPAGGAERRERARVLEFLKAVWAELQRVQWPNRKQLTQLTGVVLFFVVVVGAYLGALDAIFSKLISSIL
jgi:preprotein translocase SecE subunit